MTRIRLLVNAFATIGVVVAAHDTSPMATFDNYASTSNWDPDLVGRYHTHAFRRLQKLYQDQPATSMSGVAEDLIEVLSEYCPVEEEEEGRATCLTKARNTVKESFATKPPRDTQQRSAQSVEWLRTIDEILMSSTDVGKEATVEALQSLKANVEHESRWSDFERRQNLVTLSVALESYQLWHEVMNDDKHPLRLGRTSYRFGPTTGSTGDQSSRRLQEVVIFFAVVKADYNAAFDDFQEEGEEITEDSITSIVIAAIVASATAFFQILFDSIPRPEPPTPFPTSSPTNTTMPTSIEPTVSRGPSTAPTLSVVPTLGEETLNLVITCVAVIDEAYEHSYDYFAQSWEVFRENYPDRPFCLLQPGVFFDPWDENKIGEYYPQGITQSMLRIPQSFLDDELTTYAMVNRDMGSDADKSDWYDICGLEGLREEGIARVAFFIDQSGSLETYTVDSSLNYFIENLDEGQVEIVAGIYNDLEYWVKPFLTNFGYGDGGDFVFEDDFWDDNYYWWCRKGRKNLLQMLKTKLKLGGSDGNPI